MKYSTTPPQVFWKQYQDFRFAAELLAPHGEMNLGDFFVRLNPMYFLLGHSAECLFKSCLPYHCNSHDLRTLYKKYKEYTKTFLSEQHLDTLQDLWRLYYPGTAANSVRYPELGDKNFHMPDFTLAMLSELALIAEPHMRANQIKYTKGLGISSNRKLSVIIQG